MKIKLFLPILLICIFLNCNTSFAFNNVATTLPSLLLKGNMFSSFENDNFYIPPHSDDSTKLVYYYPLDFYEFGYEVGRVFIHFTDIPSLILNESDNSPISFVYTYDLDFCVAGEEYALSANTFIGDSPNLNPHWQSASIYDWNGSCYLKFTVYLTYTNMGSDAVISDFDLNVPAFDFQIISLGYMNPVYYLKDIWSNVSVGFESLRNKLDTINSTISSKFDNMFDQMEEQHDQILNGFDDSAGNQINSDFNDTVADLDQAEDNLFALAENQINYSSYEDFFKLSSVEGAIGFVSSWMQSIYVSLGVFGMPILIGLLLIVVTRIIGYQNFSAGGG